MVFDSVHFIYYFKICAYKFLLAGTEGKEASIKMCDSLSKHNAILVSINEQTACSTHIY